MSAPLAIALLLSSAAGPQGLESRVTLEGLDGREERLPLAELSLEVLDARVALVRFPHAPQVAATTAGEAHLELAGGDRLVGRLVGGRGESLVVRLIGGVRLELPIDDLRSVVVPDLLPDEVDLELEAPDEGDRLYRRVGNSVDRIDGAVESFEAEGLSFDSLLGTRTFPWSEVAALYVEVFSSGGSGDAREGSPVAVDLVDGSRLRGLLESLDGERCLLRRRGGTVLEIPTAVVSEVVLDDGSLTFLSERVPDEVEEGSPFGDDLGLVRRHRMDRSVEGSVLRAGGRSWARGIGVASPSRLRWNLEGERWSELRGQVAIDDGVLHLAARGSVVFQVRVDGELRWESPVVRGGEAPLAIPPVDLEGAKTLDLEVTEASDLHIADWADWLRVRLVRYGD